ncbi:MFS transporter [Acrocarpospora phusangensis]|uniref:MFS transporter n=1 Tax=Acrocarpospora phusangensis TaxID=1070424 RepID=A0A919QKS2_9ACTN|nr:MFS transporter [Acrocarpospora phusangensis]
MYAVLFTDAGLSPAQISSLFAIWSVTSFALEIPSGVWADVFSRRAMLVAAPAVTGAGFALWTFFPGYPAFAAGFVLWGAGTAAASGTLQALMYEELARLGAADSYAKVSGRQNAVGTTAGMIATALAAPAMAAGGYLLAGLASVAACLAAAALARTLPESRTGSFPEEEDEPQEGYVAVLRSGLGEVRASPRLRHSLILVAAVMGVSALDEYLPLLAVDAGVGTAGVPWVMLMLFATATAGGWLAGRGVRWTAHGLAAAALLLAAGAAWRTPWALALVAVAYGVVEWATAAMEADLQDDLTDRTRATVTSMSGLGAEVFAVLSFATYALGSVWAQPWLLFTVAAGPYLLIAVAAGRVRGGRRRTGPGRASGRPATEPGEACPPG